MLPKTEIPNTPIHAVPPPLIQVYGNHSGDGASNW